MTDIVDQTLKAWRQSAMIYGHNDCLLSISDYVRSRGGPDVAAIFRGRYDTKEGALGFIAEYGGAEHLIALAGLPEIAPADAKRGDIGLLDTGDAIVAALCTGDSFAARLERGTVEISRRLVRISHAWKVV